MLGQLKISQHNTARGREILHSFFEVALKEKATLLFVQEPYLVQDQSSHSFIPISHPSFIPILPEIQCFIRPRVLAYVQQGCPFQLTPRYDLATDPDFQILEVSHPQESFLIIHIYNERSRDQHEHRNTVQRFLNLQLPASLPFLLLGDFNLHHPSWNPLVQAPSLQAEQFANYLEQINAHQLMDPFVIEELGGTFHRPNTVNTSVIDLAFVSGFNHLSWQDWRYAESTGSDHEAIIFQAEALAPLNTSSPATKLLPARYNLKKADWVLFNNYLLTNQDNINQLLDSSIEFADSDSVAGVLQDMVQGAADSSIPQSRPCSRSKSWWTEKLTNLRHSYHQHRRRAKLFAAPAVQEEAKIVRNTYFKAISHAKASHWEEFLSSAKEKMIFKAYNYTKTSTQPRHFIPALQYQMTNPLTNETESGVAISFKDKCQALVQGLFPKSSLSPTDVGLTAFDCNIASSSSPLGRTCSDGQKWDWPGLTIGEIKAAIPNKKTAPGIDQLDWTIIKAAMECVPTIFFKAYNYLFNSGQHPSRWKQAIGIILPKQNKKDYSEPRAYRPISLLPCLSKLLERIYANRLSFLGNTTTNLFHNSQMGGRKQRSAIDAAILLQHFIESNTKRGRIVSTVFLDILGAFDRLEPAKLIQVMGQLELPKQLIKWVGSFLTNRTIRLLFNGELSDEFAVSGTPQGSPVSPILFLLSIRFLLANTHTNNTLRLSYIDDLSISCASTSVSKNVRELEVQLDTIFSTAQSISVTFEKEKSELIHFCNKQFPILTPLKVDQILLHPKEVVRWLGIWYDRKLTFKTHVDKRLQLANGALQRIIMLASPTKGLKFNALRQLYLSCVTSVLDYGSVMWSGRYGKQQLTNKYQKLQNRAVRYITGAYPSSPAQALQVEAAILPTPVRHLKLENNYALRILGLQTNHPILEVLTQALQDELDTSPLQTTGDIGMFRFVDQCPSRLFQLAKLLKEPGKFGNMEQSRQSWVPPWLTTSIKTTISQQPKDVARTEHLNLLAHLSLETCLVYTDGSLSLGGSSSIGFIIYLPVTRQIKCYSFNLGNRMGITDTETYCILKAIQTVKKLNISGDIFIFSDSQASLSRIQTKPTKICHQIRSSAKNLSLHFHWCPGHMGIEGNEMADKLAKAGEKRPAMRKDKYTTLSFLREKMRQQLVISWKQRWQSELFREEEGRKAKGLGKYYRIFALKNTPDFKLKPYNYNKYSRRTQVEYFQARTGIGNTLAYLKKIGKSESDWCDYCGEGRQTVPHLILHCKKFKVERRKYFAEITPLKLSLLFGTHVGKTALLCFLDSTKCLRACRR